VYCYQILQQRVCICSYRFTSAVDDLKAMVIYESRRNACEIYVLQGCAFSALFYVVRYPQKVVLCFNTDKIYSCFKKHVLNLQTDCTIMQWQIHWWRN
jgi:hypothetical protein